ncbi:MAG TPA: GxxExxY protein [Lacunisphaera sp.]|nr:GxxExxY protein [Lacunisphaera sp.]
MELIHAAASERVIGCCLRVHKVLGPGFLESIYEAALGEELTKAALPFERQKAVPVLYEGKLVGELRLDLLVDHTIVLELKACAGIEDVHLATARSYLRATGLQLALVINFSRPVLDIRRVVLTR